MANAWVNTDFYDSDYTFDFVEKKKLGYESRGFIENELKKQRIHDHE